MPKFETMRLAGKGLRERECATLRQNALVGSVQFGRVVRQRRMLNLLLLLHIDHELDQVNQRVRVRSLVLSMKIRQ
jgi:hypothetical protein